MHSDEDQIRQLIATWHAATRAGDIDTVLGLMTDDVVFLVPGRHPMRKAEFEALSRVPSGSPPPDSERTIAEALRASKALSPRDTARIARTSSVVSTSLTT